MKFFAVLASLIWLVAVVVADYNAVTKDIEVVNANLLKVQDALSQNDGRDYFKSLGIHTLVSVLVNSLETATKDVKACAVLTDAQVDPLLKKLKVSELTTIRMVSRLHNTKDGYKGALVAGVVKNSLSSLHNAVAVFSEAAISRCPDNRKVEANAISTSIISQIQSAQKDFS